MKGRTTACYILVLVTLDVVYAAREKVNKRFGKHDIKNTIDDKKTRSLTIGDTITPKEMVVIAEKLIKQVTIPNGKGIVSSSKNQYELADKLFLRTFTTLKRIVEVRDVDIFALDALQALSLNGEIADPPRDTTKYTNNHFPHFPSFTESPKLLYKGFELGSGTDYSDVNTIGKSCHYKVISKPLTKDEENKITNARVGIDKMLGDVEKNQMLVANNKNNKKYANASKNKPKRKLKMEKLKEKSNKKGRSKINLERKPASKTNIVCRWKYVCSVPSILSTCRVQRVCKNPEDAEIEEPVDIQRFRRMVGLDPIDEEVEKIMELHYYLLRPVNVDQQDKDQQVESLAEYFNLMIERSGATVPLSRSVTKAGLMKKHIDNSRGLKKVTENADDVEARSGVTRSMKAPKKKDA